MNNEEIKNAEEKTEADLLVEALSEVDVVEAYAGSICFQTQC